MTDPTEDQFRRALDCGAARFSPTADLGVTRGRVVGGVRGRQRQVFALGAAAVVLLVSGGVVAAAAGGSGGAASRQVAARGAGLSAPASSDSTTTIAVAAGGVAVGPTGTGAVTPGSVTPPPSSAPSGGPETTAVHTTTTVQKPPPVTSPSTTALPPSVPEVHGTVRFSPVCPVERIPPDPACAPRPGAAHIQLLRADATVAAQGDAGSSGDFTIAVAPGTYTVKATTGAATASIGGGCTANPAQVTVAANKGATVAVSCDTGIR